MKKHRLVAITLQAIKVVRPAVEGLIAEGITGKRGTAWLVIAIRKHHGSESFGDFMNQDVLFSGLLLGEEDRAKWKHDFKAIATAKAFKIWRTGLNDEVMQDQMPTAIQEGDSQWWGGDVAGEIVAACSGFQEFIDKLVSRMLTALINALARFYIETAREQNTDLINIKL